MTSIPEVLRCERSHFERYIQPLPSRVFPYGGVKDLNLKGIYNDNPNINVVVEDVKDSFLKGIYNKQCLSV